LAQGDTSDATFCADELEAQSIEKRLREFTARHCAFIERSLHGRLLALWEGIPAQIRPLLRWHFIVTMRRDANDFGANPLHADTFDGTMVAFALMCNKITTPVYPSAHFSPPALERFVAEAAGQPGVTRPSDIHLRSCDHRGPRYTQRDGTILVLPPSVCHSIPNDIQLNTVSTVDSRGETLATKDYARWFCRVSIEIIPANEGNTEGGAWHQWQQAWPDRQTRQHVALLAAEHVWGVDPSFLAAAKAALCP
jgi:hypothetical protein